MSTWQVGAIDVDALDTVWEAALRWGFKPATDGWPQGSIDTLRTAAAEAKRGEAAVAARRTEAVSAQEPTVTGGLWGDNGEEVTTSDEDGGSSRRPAVVNKGGRTPSPPNTASSAMPGLGMQCDDEPSPRTIARKHGAAAGKSALAKRKGAPLSATRAPEREGQRGAMGSAKRLK